MIEIIKRRIKELENKRDYHPNDTIVRRSKIEVLKEILKEIECEN